MESRPQRWDRGLYLVPTPIGNLSDISYRALEALRIADIILCEDTRVTKKLCAYYDVDTKLMPFHDHNEGEMAGKVVSMLKDGQIIALVSDAGTPLISDPGYKLVRDCAKAGVKVIALPGANAVLPGLQLSAFPTDQFYFGGFLPSKAGERESLLTANMARFSDMTQCYYESPKRLKACLQAIADIDSAREVAVVREISKLHEEAIRGTAQDVLNILNGRDSVKGEIVLMIAPQSSESSVEITDDSLVQIVQNLMETMPLKKVASDLSAITSFSKNEIYDLGIALKNKKK